MDMTDDYTAQNLGARQRDVMKRGLSNKEIANILNLAEGLTAKECLQSAEVCLALLTRLRNSTQELPCLSYRRILVTERVRRQRLELAI